MSKQKTKNKKALIGYVTIMLVFALFVTRQNIISLGVETFFIYSIMRGRVSFVKILILSVTVLFLFSIIGGMRSGDIKEIASIRRDFMWIPSAFIWLYSYCYFNILNLDNLVSYPGVPVYDLSSLSGFIPSFIRPDGKSVYILEVSNFNVSSYLSSLYKDMGHMWILVFTITMAIVSKSRVNKFLENANFKNISIAAVLYFCALFSFFVNFWTYLPVIFQIFFILIFDKYTIKNEER
ncbi:MULTISPECIES: oligosaccharide repeat unit polymerase [Pectobacterium]|uniref:oligosaccharide repeat unit polymerase n=1 Tax=Pectobacterium TaxID=122277 RepID=UPI00389A417F